VARLCSVLSEVDRLLPKGADLRAQVQVPPSALGLEGGVWVRVPRELPGGGLRHRRVEVPGEPGDRLLLHLPDGLPDGAILRLGARGAAAEGERPGDLLVKVEVREGALDGTWIGAASAPLVPGRVNALVWAAVALGLALLGVALWAGR